jgi:formylglycine-generating enzyme required for sulfatase activity
LQVYLDMLYREDYKRDYGDRERGDELPPLLFTREEIEAFGDINNVLEKFLREQTEELQKKLEEDYSVPPQTVRRLLDAFVTEEGTKRPVRLHTAQVGKLPVAGELKPVADLSESALSSCLIALEELRLLRIADDTAELAHDSLAQLIDRQRTDEERQLNEVRRRIRVAFENKERWEVWPTERQLLSMEELLPRIELDNALRDFIQQSFKEIERIKAEEAEAEIRARRLIEAEAQAEQERKLKLEAENQRIQAESAKVEAENQRAHAERNERRAAKQTRLAVMISLLALVLAGFTGWFYFVAYKQRLKAEISSGEARAATQKAEINYAAAVQNLFNAQQQEKQAKAALAMVAAEKEATEVQRLLAERNYERAQAATKEASAERNRAQRALDALADANTAFVRLLLQNKENDVLSMNYKQAYENVKSASILKAEQKAVAAAALELAFWYGETGNQARADEMLHLAYASLNKRLDKNQPLRDAIEWADKKVFDDLMMRYYPLDTVRLAGGTFEMGCNPKRDDVYECGHDEKLHNQQVRGFIVSRHETTWWQYLLFCEASDRDFEKPYWRIQGDNPVVNVNWYDAVEYANWVSERLGLDAAYTVDKENEDTNNTDEFFDKLKWTVHLQSGSKGYRLLTEAEWEYAARGGQEETFAGCNDETALRDYAWYRDNTFRRTQAVKGKTPNLYGLHDMSGNVWEWCWDWGGAYPEVAQIDYSGPTTGSYRIVRGGSWGGVPQDCRVALRSGVGPNNRYGYLGFRLARTP